MGQRGRPVHEAGRRKACRAKALSTGSLLLARTGRRSWCNACRWELPSISPLPPHLRHVQASITSRDSKRETGLMLKGLFIVGACAAAALALSVAAEIVPLSDVVAATSEFSCEFRDAFQL